MEFQNSSQNIEKAPKIETPVPIISNKTKVIWTVPIAFLILGILVGMGGFWGYQNFRLGQKQAVSSPIPTVTTDLTTNWKTYTDTKLGIEFKYPENLTYKKLENGVVQFIDLQDKTKFNFSGLRVLSPTEYKSYIQEIEKNAGAYDPKTFTDSQDRIWQTSMELGEVFNFDGVLNQSDKFYLVGLQSNYSQESDNGVSFRNFANQTLSTFKFTTPSFSPAPTQKPSTFTTPIPAPKASPTATNDVTLPAPNQHTTYSLTVTSPNGGETFKNGTYVPIAWKLTGTGQFSFFKIYYSECDGCSKTYYTTLNGVEFSYSNFYLNFPTSSLPKQLKIRIEGIRGDTSEDVPFDESDNYFTVTQ